MSRFAFAYIIQLDLPGGPVKIGRSANPRSRFKTLDIANPCEARFIGITLDGFQREADMLAATETRKIKGEWRYPTRELFHLVAQYHAAGEWFVPASDHQAHFDASDVAARVHRIVPETTHEVCPMSLNHHWTKDVLAKVAEHDRMIPVDWSGLVPSPAFPSFSWPCVQDRAA